MTNQEPLGELAMKPSCSLPERCPNCGVGLGSNGAMTWFEHVDVRRVVEVIGGKAYVESGSEEIVASVPDTEELACGECCHTILRCSEVANWEDLVEHVDFEEIEKLRRKSLTTADVALPAARGDDDGDVR